MECVTRANPVWAPASPNHNTLANVYAPCYTTAMKICPIEGCGRERGLGGRRRLCEAHYWRLRRFGSADAVTPPPKKTPRDERFWQKVEKTDTCWLWRGSKNTTGYGQLRTDRLEKAHRISWEIHNGPIPDGLAVLHACDNPPCVNPSHLWLGTQADNARDRQAKGRQNRRPGDLRRTIPTKANGRWKPRYSRNPKDH